MGRTCGIRTQHKIRVGWQTREHSVVEQKIQAWHFTHHDVSQQLLGVFERRFGGLAVAHVGHDILERLQ